MSQDGNGKRPGAIKRRDLLKAFSIVPAAFIPVGAAVAGPALPASRHGAGDLPVIAIDALVS